MATILDWLSQVKQPDIVGSFYNGQQQAQERQARGLALLAQQRQQQDQQRQQQAQDAYRALAPDIFGASTPGQQQAVVAKAGAIDPNLGFSLQDHFAKLDDAKKQNLQDFAEQMARDAYAVKQIADPAQRDAAYKAKLAEYSAQGHNVSQFANLPTDQGINLALATAQKVSDLIPKPQGMMNIAPGGSVYDPNQQKVMYSAPTRPANAVPLNTAQGPMAFDPTSGTMKPIMMADPSNAQSDFLTIASSAPGAIVTSLDRTTEHNAAVGGVANSQHIPRPGQADGTAMDIVPTPATKQQIINIAKAKGYQVIDEGNHLHIQIPNGAGMQAPAFTRGAAADAGAANNLLTPEGQELVSTAMASGYSIPLPTFGMGAAAGKTKAEAINALAKKWKDAGISAQDGVSAMIQGKTATAGLTQLQKTYAGVAGWEESAKAQAKIALTLSNNLGRTNYPLLNRALLAGKQQIGDPRVDPLLNSVNTLAEEYAKVIGAGNAAATDSARALAHSMFNTAQTQQQFQAVVDNMLKEMAGRTGGLQTAISHQRQSVIGQPDTTQKDFSHLWNGP